eukprot:COSAG06_NODE_1588_length_9007_cov_115.131452_8_plen_71_part_00
MFVPSLSWQNDHFRYKLALKSNHIIHDACVFIISVYRYRTALVRAHLKPDVTAFAPIATPAIAHNPMYRR